MADGDELHRKLVNSPGNKPFRKIKKHVGETWKPDTRIQPNSELGIWCAACRTTHAWRNRKALQALYERSSTGNWNINWTCTKTGNVLKVEGLVTREK